MALNGSSVDLLHDSSEREDVNIVFELPRDLRARTEDLLTLYVRSEMNPQAPLVQLRELVRIETTLSERNIYHKNLKPVTYVTADVAGAIDALPAMVLSPEAAPRTRRRASS